MWLKTPKGREAIKRQNRRRYARQKGIIHAFTNAQWQEKVKAANGICPQCHEAFTKDRYSIRYPEIDHIIPIFTRKKKVYTIDDVQVLCRSCNSKKNQHYKQNSMDKT